MAKLISYEAKTALITGASSGIGERLALEMAHRGARVILVARRLDELQRVAKTINDTGGKAVVLACDVADRARVFAAAQHALDEYGPIDILVNNAGYGRHRRFIQWDLDDAERMMTVNFFGSVYWTRALLPQMIARRSGWLVFMASVAGKLGVPDESLYAASKFALVGLAEALSYEVEDAGVHVLTVCPGAINTPFFDEEAIARMPAVAKRLMIEPDVLVTAILKALARGKREITVPGIIRAGYIVRALFPGFMHRNTKRTALRTDR